MIIPKHILTQSTLSSFAEWRSLIADYGAVALLDKDRNWTSFDVVAKMRGLAQTRKVGHAGTLDPLATGLLILCFGKATKTIDEFQAQQKSYHAVVRLGATTATDDAEAPEENIAEPSKIAALTLESATQAVERFVGTIEQVPPMYSAIKKDGVPLYKLARKGKTLELAPRTVSIYAAPILAFEPPFLTLSVECSKGTYIRSLARDIGAALGVGGYLHSLRRTSIGAFSVQDAVRIADVMAAAERVS
jgi:tRNA pseudouridine55 synthase